MASAGGHEASCESHPTAAAVIKISRMSTNYDGASRMTDCHSAMTRAELPPIRSLGLDLLARLEGMDGRPTPQLTRLGIQV